MWQWLKKVWNYTPPPRGCQCQCGSCFTVRMSPTGYAPSLEQPIDVHKLDRMWSEISGEPRKYGDCNCYDIFEASYYS